MPGIEDWKIRPAVTIKKIFEENEGCSHDEFVTKVEEHFSRVLDSSSVSRVPLLNSVPMHQLQNGMLVRYRCMVQDVFDPQFCFSQYRVYNTETQSSRVELGLFQDVSSLGPNEVIDYNSKENVTVERQGFYCVPIPGESNWVKQAYKKGGQKIETESQSSSESERRLKREREGEGEPDDLTTAQKTSKTEKIGSSHLELTSKSEMPDLSESSSSGEAQTVSLPVLNLNFPLPGETGVPCIVRVYSSRVELRPTDAVEIVGILSVDPQLACMFDDDDSNVDILERDELQAHEPPPSLVPRLHALVTRRLPHNNPHVDSHLASETYKTDFTNLMEDAGSLRLELLSIIEEVLLGDRLTAEYFVCNFMSSVYARVDNLPLGKLSLNISGCPSVAGYAGSLHHLISQLVSQSLLIDMSIDNMNTLPLVPSKDYKQNRLTAGMLQLGSGTHLVLNETALQQGQLNHTGVSNIKALADIISWQKVEYDYQWHPVPIHTDLPVIVLSDGESLLPKDVHIPLEGKKEILDAQEYFSKLGPRLTEENLAKLRSYITSCRLIDYSFPEELQKIVQEDFVEMRQANHKDMSVNDFHRMLCLVRTLTCSYGQSSPSLEMWMKVKAMEEARRTRTASLPRPNRT